MRILLCRHGESQANKEGIIQGCGYDTSLSERGIYHSDLLADKILRYIVNNNLNPYNIYCSKLKRSRETAQIIKGVLEKRFSNIKIISDERLNERKLGILEGLSTREARKKYPEAVEDMFSEVDDWANVTPGGGESQQELAKRIKNFISNINNQSQGQINIIVGHFGPIQHIIGEIIGMPMVERFYIRSKHDGLIVLSSTNFVVL